MELVSLFPTWYEPSVGSGWVVALIATFHVLASHTSVGAALVNAYLSHKAYVEDRDDLLEFVKKYGLFLMVFTYVAGSITGPGIWYSTTVASPVGIGSLIHVFVWKWATEWVFFVIEVVGVYMIVYTVGRVSKQTHRRLSLIFGAASLTTLVIIVGILSFMMVPGKEEAWYETGSYLDAFYGGNTFMQLFMRMAFMFTITAVVAGIIIGGLKDDALKKELARKFAILGIVATIIGAVLFQGYLATVPEQAKLVMANRLPDFFQPSIIITLVLTIGYFVITWIQPKVLVPAFAGSMVVILLVAGLWPEETARESMRKPYVAGQFVYSNQVVANDVPGLRIKSQLPILEKQGMLASHPFTPEHLRKVDGGNVIQAGEYLAMTYCSNCHSPSGTGIRPLNRYFNKDTPAVELEQYVKGVLTRGHIGYMPKMPMSDDEAHALAEYLYLVNQGDGDGLVKVAIAREAEKRREAAAQDAANNTLSSAEEIE